MKLFSVITIASDNPQSFERTATSVANQQIDRSEVEWIVVNGSRRTQHIRDMIETKQDIISWSQSQPDGGIYEAMNIGIEHATGRFISFMNAGDAYSSPTTLQNIAALIENSPDTDFVYGDTLRQGRFLRRATPFTPKLDHMNTRHQSMLFRRDTLGGQHYNLKYRITADLDFFLNYAPHVRRPLYTGFPVSDYEPGGISESRSVQTAIDSFMVRQDHTTPLARNLATTAATMGIGLLRRYAPELYGFMITAWQQTGAVQEQAPVAQDLTLS